MTADKYFIHAAATLSGTLHELARKAAVRGQRRARKRWPGESVFWMQETIEVVILVGAASEAAINEVISVSRPLQRELPPDTKLREKWKRVPEALGLPRLEMGRRPWQDFHHLVELRNAFVHYDWGAEPHVLAEWMRTHRMIHKHSRSWTDAVQTNLVAIWAVNVLPDIWDELAGAVASSPRLGGMWQPGRFRRLRVGDSQRRGPRPSRNQPQP